MRALGRAAAEWNARMAAARRMPLSFALRWSFEGAIVAALRGRPYGS